MKVLVGMGLVLTGGAMVMGSAFAGFAAGIAVMQWGLEQDEKETVDKAIADVDPGSPDRPGHVRYQSMSSREGSLDCPADGTNLTMDRKNDINDSTPENPITITLAEALAMTTEHVLIHMQTGRFRLEKVA